MEVKLKNIWGGSLTRPRYSRTHIKRLFRKHRIETFVHYGIPDTID